MFKTGAQMFLLVLLAGFFLLRESQEKPCATVDEVFSAWIAVNGPGVTHPETAPVTLVAIDDSSVSGHHGPWTPLDYSLFAEGSQAFHSEVTAFTDILQWDSKSGTQGERQKLVQYESILQDSLLRSPKVLLAARLGLPEDPQVIPPLQEVPLIRKVSGNIWAIPEWTVIERQPKEEYRLPATIGFVNLPESSTPIQSVPLVLLYRGGVVPSLVLQAVVMREKLSLDDVSVVLGSHIDVGGKLHIPIDESGRMRVNFGVPWTSIAFDDLVLAKNEADAKTKITAPVEHMKGGITLLARTDASSRTLSAGAAHKISEGELFAAAIATIQKQAFVRRVPIWFDFATIGVIALVSLWVPRRKKLTIFTVGILVIIAYGLAAMAVFASQSIWIPLVLPVGLILFVMAYRLVTPNLAKPETPAPAETGEAPSPTENSPAA